MMNVRYLAIAIAIHLPVLAGSAADFPVTQLVKQVQPKVATVRVHMVSRSNVERLKAVKVRRKKAKSGGKSDQTSRSTQVAVLTGVLLGDGNIVSPVYAASDTPIRVTLPGGEQVRGRVRVIDEYSGLSLINCGRKDLPGIKIEPASPAVGSMVVSFAAWGLQKPVVSIGFVSGVRRNINNVHFPPLLQCQLRTEATSSGAPLVNKKGRLVGIVVFSQLDRSRGWTYCVPARHVERLLRAQPKDPRSDNVVIIKRRRPIVGMVLDDNGSGIRVSRVRKDSPASKAGIKVGDHVLAVDGMKIRSVYQAVIPNLNKQPGDVTEFLIRQQATVRVAKVVLGGGVELPSAPFENLGDLVSPRVRIRNYQGQYWAFRNQQWQNVPVSRNNSILPVNRSAATKADATKVSKVQTPWVRFRQPASLTSLQKRIVLYEKLLKVQEQQIKLQKQEIGLLKRNQKSLQSQVKSLRVELTNVRGVKKASPAPKK